MNKIYQAILDLIEQNSPGCEAIKRYLTSQKRKYEFPLNWCDFSSIATMLVFLDRGEECSLVCFSTHDQWGDHYCIKKDGLYSDFTIQQFPDFEQPLIESQIHPFSEIWDKEYVLDSSALKRRLQTWPQDVNEAIDKFTDDLKNELST